MQRVAIVGLGLMGGSLGLALRRLDPRVEVFACARRAETRERALADGAADAVFDSPAAAVRGAAVAVFCAPVLVIPELVERCLDAFADGCAVTDVGSTKRALMDRLAPRFAGRGAAFVGSHPIAGSDRTGLEAARADLYRGAMVVVTPSGRPDEEEACARTVDFWRLLGARTAVMDAARHDDILARTSHLPHLAAALLVETVCRDASARRFCGTGFRDTTRVAGGSDELWHDIVKTNREPVLAELAAFGAAVERLRAMVAAGDFEGLRLYLARTMETRRALAEEEHWND